MKTTSFSPARILLYALMISSLALSLSPGMGPSALAQSATPNPPPPPPHITTDAETGRVRFIGGTSQAPLALTSAADAALKSPREIAEGFLQVRGSAFGLPQGTGAGLSVLRETSAADGRSFERFQQTYQGVPILGGELIVQMDAGKNVLSTSGQVSSGLNLSVTPALNAGAAQAAALAAAKEQYPEAAALLAPSGAALYIYDTQIYDRQSALAQKLVWQVVVSTSADPNSSQTVLPVRQQVLVDAQTGEIVRQFSTLENALNRKIYSCNSSTSCLEYHIDGKPFTEDYSTVGDNAYLYISDTYNFYKQTFGRDSIDGKGMALIGKFDYSPDGQQYHNALWDGTQLLFGQGYVVPDLTAHEFTHGVTAHESKLVYLDQSGAINESLSDIFGQFVELFYDHDHDAENSNRWLIGEDVSDSNQYAPPFRDMADPTNSTNPPNRTRQPDSITSPLYYCGFDDNGGVHTNSGVGNKAAYLITDGGTFNDETIPTGLGIEKTAKLFYDVQANLLTSKAEYPDLADALKISCSSQSGPGGIFTTDDCGVVDQVIQATQMNQTPCLGARGYVNPLATSVIRPIGDISATAQPLNPTFVWRQRADSSKYQLLLKDSKGRVIYQNWLDDNLTNCPNASCALPLLPALATLKYGEHYTWAVQTHNLIGDGPWSPSKTFFTTLPGTPGQVTKTDPPDTTIIDTVQPKFQWTPLDGATGYLLKIEQRVTLSPPVYKPYLSMPLNPDLVCPPGGSCTTLPSKALLANGAYRWSVTAQFGPKSGLDPTWFTLTVNPLPGKVVINSLSPATSLTPALNWNADLQATGYIVTITGTAGKIIHTYDQSGDLSGCPGAVCAVDLPRLEGGKQVVTVQASSSIGLGPVSDARTLSISAPQAPMDLSAPTNTILPPLTTNRPIFAWVPNSLATTYTLQVTGPVTFKKTYKSMDVCGAFICTVPAEVTFKPSGVANTYHWSVTAVNKAGSWPSALWSFSVPTVGTTPFVPKLSGPLPNALVDATQLVTLQWTGDSAAADQYILKLSGPNHYFTQRFIPASVSDLTCTGDDCAWPFPDLLPLGRYTWTLTGSNHGVLGKTSPVFSFTSALPAPVITAPVDGSTPSAYQLNAGWQPVVTAKAYHVQLTTRLNKVLYNQTWLASQVCTLTACTAALPPGLLPDTGYHLAVKGLDPTGFGLQGDSTFAVDLTSFPNFDGEFNNSQDGWVDVGPTGHWYLAPNHKYWSNTGVKSSLLKAWEFTSNAAIVYTDLDAVVAVQRLGCATCSTSLLVRGAFNPTPNKAIINTGYRFDIRGDGKFSVIRMVAGHEIVLQAWTSSPAIHKGSGWNTLRAVAISQNLWYMINGKLVWLGMDNYLPPITLGRVAVGMESIGPSDELNIDWARGYAAQAVTTSAAQLGQVDPLQRALNQAANAQAAGAGRQPSAAH